ncbi:MAG: YgcG family protein [Burkholderiales bacterium]
MRHLLAALLALAAVFGTARAEVPVPPLAARVTDLTGTLNAQQKAALEARIATWEKQRGSQLAVLMLPTTKPEEIEQYSIRVAEAWKIGRKGVDDGLILLVAKEDRRVRIEVGYGLEGVIPDAVARRVIEERITPRLRAGDFHGGIRDGVEQLIRLAEGEKLPPPQAGAGGAQDAADQVVPLLVFAFIAAGILKAIFGRFLGAVATGGILGVGAWFLFGAVAAAIFGIIGFVITYAGLGRGAAGVGGWSGGGSRGGGFGGGGGGFGGGGASGRW